MLLLKGNNECNREASTICFTQFPEVRFDRNVFSVEPSCGIAKLVLTASKVFVPCKLQVAKTPNCNRYEVSFCEFTSLSLRPRQAALRSLIPMTYFTKLFALSHGETINRDRIPAVPLILCATELMCISWTMAIHITRAWIGKSIMEDVLKRTSRPFFYHALLQNCRLRFVLITGQDVRKSNRCLRRESTLRQALDCHSPVGGTGSCREFLLTDLARILQPRE